MKIRCCDSENLEKSITISEWLSNIQYTFFCSFQIIKFVEGICRFLCGKINFLIGDVVVIFFIVYMLLFFHFIIFVVWKMIAKQPKQFWLKAQTNSIYIHTSGFDPIVEISLLITS